MRMKRITYSIPALTAKDEKKKAEIEAILNAEVAEVEPMGEVIK